MIRGPGKSSLFNLLALTALAATPLLFQNCQRPVQRSIASVAAHDDAMIALPEGFPSETAAAAAPFADGKVQIGKIGDRAVARLAGKTSGPLTLPAGQTLIVILRNACARETPGAVTAQAYAPGEELPGLETQTYTWTLAQATPLAQIQAAADADPCVIGVSHDDVMTAERAPGDPGLASQSTFLAIGGADSYSFFADPLHGARGEVLVAVIDSGVNASHEDLKNVLWHNPVNDAIGYDFNANGVDTSDDFGHGTLVSGLIAAQANNGLGIAGVMGHDLKLMPLKVQNSTGTASISNINRALDYARSKNADVINISMVGTNDQPALLAAMNAAVSAGAFIAVAAGNEGKVLPATPKVVPAEYAAGIDGVMAVGSTDAYSGARSGFSNYGAGLVEIAAPGSGGVYSTTRAPGYGGDQGTSFSSPLVAGAAALVVGFFRKNGIASSPALVEQTLKSAALVRPSLTSTFEGGRTLDLRALALYLRQTYLAPVDGGFDEN